MKRSPITRDTKPTRKGQTAYFKNWRGQREAWTAATCWSCGALTWVCQGWPGTPECKDCPKERRP